MRQAVLITLFAGLAVWGAGPTAAWGNAGVEHAGVVTFLSGSGQRIERNGRRHPVTKGMVIYSGDILRTSRKGRMQARMADNALFSVHPNTVLALDTYLVSTKKGTAKDRKLVGSSGGTAYMRLLRGGFRTISGWIGKKKRNNYRMATPYGVIGIRGTDYTALICETRCEAPLTGAMVDEGLHVWVSEGAVSVSNALGAVVVEPGGSATIESESSGPVSATSDDASATGRGFGGLTNSAANGDAAALVALMGMMESPMGQADDADALAAARDRMLARSQGPDDPVDIDTALGGLVSATEELAAIGQVGQQDGEAADLVALDSTEVAAPDGESVLAGFDAIGSDDVIGSAIDGEVGRNDGVSGSFGENLGEELDHIEFDEGVLDDDLDEDDLDEDDLDDDDLDDDD